MIDDFAKHFLRGRLEAVREALVWKLDALSEYDVRRPLTPTGTNLLGLVKHLATCEAWRPPGMPATLTSCVSSSTAGPG